MDTNRNALPTATADTATAAREASCFLIGNPNSGKSSLFNRLTGLRQKTGNFSGVTVEKKEGRYQAQDGTSYRVTDLPGLYSLQTQSPDEQVVVRYLENLEAEDQPPTLVFVTDITQLRRGLYLFLQLLEHELPLVLALTMADQWAPENTQQLAQNLEKMAGVPVVPVNARSGEGMEALEAALPRAASPQGKEQLQAQMQAENGQESQQSIVNTYYLAAKLLQEAGYHRLKPQSKKGQGFSALDRVLTHPVAGYLIFVGVLLLIFQALFSWSAAPMDQIDGFFGAAANWAAEKLPEGPFFDLLSEGLIPGIGGILVFVPQIAFLFLFIAILEETGYMARVIYLMDSVMGKFGLHGKSVVPLVSGLACAVPAIMSARTINDPKERLITIFVTPFMSCSARLPVFTVMIGLAVPPHTVLGFLDLRALTLLVLYFLGVFFALISALVMTKILKAQSQSSLAMALPDYRMPHWKNTLIEVLNKVKTFVWEAGRIILAISVVLWVLTSYGPPQAMDQAEKQTLQQAEKADWSPEKTERLVASRKLEASFAGQFGRVIEPAIAPLGYDWKIGIALITSFAAREVFVGTMATIYPPAGEANAQGIVKRLQEQTDPETGRKVFSVPTAFSLLMFYLLALQCMSTVAIVKRETNSWKWPLIQLGYMTGLAYLLAWLTFEVASGLV